MFVFSFLSVLFVFCSATKDGVEHRPCTITGDDDPASTPSVPKVWLGEGPNCEADPSHCSWYGLEYLCSSTAGDDKGNCSVGYQVLCASLPSPPAQSPPTAVHVLQVVTYNLYELRYVIGHSGQRERTCRVPRALVEATGDVDVIVFNEVFSGGCWVREGLTLRDLLDQFGFSYWTRTIRCQKCLKPENGGVFIASRWPIEQSQEYIFEDTDPTTADVFSAKGVVYARVNKTVGALSQVYHLFGTHMQAQEGTSRDEVRVNQAVEMHRFKESLAIPTSEPVIYAGDLNADKKGKPDHFEQVLSKLDSSLPEITGAYEYSYDPVTNDLLDGSRYPRQWLDYVVYDNQHLTPVSSTLRILKLVSAEAFPVCWRSLSPGYLPPFDDQCLQTRSINDLSDHYAVRGILNYS